MAMEKFQEWYEKRHEYQKDWKKRTGGKMIGFFVPILLRRSIMPLTSFLCGYLVHTKYRM